MAGENLRADLARQRAELDAIAQAAERLTVDATSRDQLVSVHVNARGLLTSLRIEPAALRRYRADQLADEITALVAAADAQIATIRDRTVATTLAAVTDYASGR